MPAPDPRPPPHAALRDVDADEALRSLRA